ncbi:hypothetical protein F4680DRAFT_415419 [Xylaria scruposa]|nr:hypothetical protein F4680DRAFT_415419 [Xylaria scruposa]
MSDCFFKMYCLSLLATTSLATADRYYSISTFNPGTQVDGLQVHAADKGFHWLLRSVNKMPSYRSLCLPPGFWYTVTLENGTYGGYGAWGLGNLHPSRWKGQI